MTKEDWEVVRIFQAVQGHSVECPVPGSEGKKVSLMLDLGTLLARLQIDQVPPVLWSWVSAGVIFLWNLEYNTSEIFFEDYPEELARGH